LICEADLYRIPVFINSVGIEDYDSTNPITKVLIKSINKRCVKSFTTRDNIPALADWVKLPTIRTGLVPDNVIAVSDIIPKQKGTSDVIGIGLIRTDIYNNYHKTDRSKDLISLYADLIKALDKEKISYELFTNGGAGDLSLYTSVCQVLGRQLPICVPTSVDNLIQTITSYRCLFTARMHAQIIAYSYDIPFYALSWVSKVDLFNNLIGHSQCCSSLDHIKISEIIAELKTPTLFDSSKREMLKSQIHAEIERITDCIVNTKYGY